MALAGSRVAVVGGSIAGCAAAIALRRAGCDVRVLERASQRSLKDRGHGIAIPLPLQRTLVAEGYLPAGHSSISLGSRRWIVADGTASGRVVWEQAPAVEALAQNWGVLWANLRSCVPHGVYASGASVASVEPVGADAVRVAMVDGTSGVFDAVVAADGYNSGVRKSLPWGTEPDFAGYILWRGSYAESRLADDASRRGLEQCPRDSVWLTVGFDGGHAVVYLIPGPDGSVEPGSRVVNWAVYTHLPPGLNFSSPSHVPPGGVDQELYDYLDERVDLLPPDIAALVRASAVDEVAIQPVYDELPVRYAEGRVLLIGDAGAVLRPHTASGATKALQDALALSGMAASCDGWDDLLDKYASDRLSSARDLVEVGRRLGHGQVEQTPNWASMTPADYEAWVKAMLAGTPLYFYDTNEGRSE